MRYAEIVRGSTYVGSDGTQRRVERVGMKYLPGDYERKREGEKGVKFIDLDTQVTSRATLKDFARWAAELA